MPACHTQGVDGDGGLGEGGLPTCAAQALEFDAVTEGVEERARRSGCLHPSAALDADALDAEEMRVPQAAGLLTTAMMTAAPQHQLIMTEDMQERLSLLPKGERSRVVFQAAGLQLPFLKARGESKEHLLMKALLWSLMVDTEMNVECELDIGHRYKPGACHRPPLG